MSLTVPCALRAVANRQALGGLVASGLLLASCTPTPPAPTVAPGPTAVPLAKTAEAPKPTTATVEAATSAPAAKPTSAPNSAAGTRPVRGGSITVALGRETATLDCHAPTAAITRLYCRSIADSLFSADAAGNVSGQLVERWEVPNPTTYVFTLRPGMLFHDGTPVNATAVEFNIERMLDPATKSPYMSELSAVASVEIVDDLTFRVMLKRPDAVLPARFADRASFIISPAAVRKLGAEFAKQPVGSGPFEFVEWVPGDHLTLKRFDRYWDKDADGIQLPYLDQITFKPVTEPSVMLTGLRTGTFDIIESVLPSDLERVKADSSLKFTEGPGTIAHLYLNNAKPPFNDPALRRALAWAIDRDAIHRGIYFHSGWAGGYYIRPTSWAFDSTIPAYTLDHNKARAELRNAGVQTGFKFSLLVDVAPTNAQLGQAVKSQLQAVGVEAEITQLETNALVARLVSGDYEAIIMTSAPSADPDNDLSIFVRTGSSLNLSRYTNPAVDELLAKAIEVSDQKQRGAAYSQIQWIYMQDIPVIQLHTNTDIKAMRTSVQGYIPRFDGFISAHRVWIQK